MKKEIIEWIICIIIAIIIGMLIKYFIGTPTIVKNVSMKPTLIEKQRLILNRISTRIQKQLPKRGEIITFEAPSKRKVSYAEVDFDNAVATYHYTFSNSFSKFIYQVLEIGKDSYIKRVIALPGEHIQIKEGNVYINGNKLQEDYLQEGLLTNSYDGVFYDLVVPQNSVFVMGDNRENSIDSRYFGCIPLEKIESKVWIRFWPLNLFGKVE